MKPSNKRSSAQSRYRIEARDGRFVVLHDCGLAEHPFSSRREASRFIKGCVTEDNLLRAARRFIGAATDSLMRRHGINRATARLWIREAAESRN
jgi:hypothetical protein